MVASVFSRQYRCVRKRSQPGPVRGLPTFRKHKTGATVPENSPSMARKSDSSMASYTLFRLSLKSVGKGVKHTWDSSRLPTPARRSAGSSGGPTLRASERARGRRRGRSRSPPPRGPPAQRALSPGARAEARAPQRRSERPLRPCRSGWGRSPPPAWGSEADSPGRPLQRPPGAPRAGGAAAAAGHSLLLVSSIPPRRELGPAPHRPQAPPAASGNRPAPPRRASARTSAPAAAAGPGGPGAMFRWAGACWRAGPGRGSGPPRRGWGAAPAGALCPPPLLQGTAGPSPAPCSGGRAVVRPLRKRSLKAPASLRGGWKWQGCGKCGFAFRTRKAELEPARQKGRGFAEEVPGRIAESCWWLTSPEERVGLKCYGKRRLSSC